MSSIAENSADRKRPCHQRPRVGPSERDRKGNGHLNQDLWAKGPMQTVMTFGGTRCHLRMTEEPRVAPEHFTVAPLLWTTGCHGMDMIVEYPISINIFDPVRRLQAHQRIVPCGNGTDCPQNHHSRISPGRIKPGRSNIHPRPGDTEHLHRAQRR